MEIKAVLFDMDGVIIDSYRAWFDTFNLTRQEFGFAPITDKEFRMECWAIAIETLLPKFFPELNKDEVMQKTEENFSRFIEEVSLIGDPKSALKGLDCKKAIVTNSKTTLAEKILEEKGIKGHFDIIIGGDAVEKGKPDPQMLEKAIRSLNIKKSEALFIGDMPTDLMTAKNAKIRFIGFRLEDAEESIKDLSELKGKLICLQKG